LIVAVNPTITYTIGMMSKHNKRPTYTVKWISAWRPLQVWRGCTTAKAYRIEKEGQDLQYKVVVEEENS